MYEQGLVTPWKATHLVQVFLWCMIDLLHERNIDLQYGLNELRQEFRSLKKEI